MSIMSKKLEKYVFREKILKAGDSIGYYEACLARGKPWFTLLCV